MTNLLEDIDFLTIDLDKIEPLSGDQLQLDYLSGDNVGKPILLKTKQPTVNLTINLKQGCRFRFFWAQIGEIKEKWQVTFNLLGESVDLGIYNLQYLKGESKVKNHLQINHQAANCQSFTLFKGALEDQAQADFFGRIYVTPEAHNTNAKLGNHNLVLSDNAKVNTKPELEIYCDDVKCTHGATIGHFDPNQDFYLQSRGLEPKVRKEVLTEAFLREVVGFLDV